MQTLPRPRSLEEQGIANVRFDPLEPAGRGPL